MENRNKIIILFFVLGVLVSFLVCSLGLYYYFNYTNSGMTDGMSLKGFVSGGRFYYGDVVNITNVDFNDDWLNFNTSVCDVVYVDRLSDFLDLNDELSANTFRCGWAHANERFVIFNSVHYSDEFPFYDWWFCDGLRVYVWNNWVGN